MQSNSGASPERVRRALSEIARANSVSEAQVRLDIEEAIMMGYGSADPSVRAEWARSPFAAKAPTVEEFIAWLADTAQGKA